MLRWMLLVGLTACAAGPSTVRDPQGQPLPTSAVLDADTAGTALHCTDGSTYTIVEPPRGYLAGTHLARYRVAVVDAPALCARIAAADRP